MKYLVLVESPAKCKKIEKYLNDNSDIHIYIVMATMGHINELRSIQSIHVENNFECNYELIESKKKNTEAIRKKIKECDEVILCCDPDREGEGIAAAICQVFHLDMQTIKRVTFHEITESAVIKAMQNPRTIDHHLVHAQQSRQILDLLVGFKVSPMLWKYITKHSANSLSAGRCQTPALRIIYDKCKEAEEQNQTRDQEQEQKQMHTIIGYFTKLNIPFELNKQFSKEEEVVSFLKGSATFSHMYSCSAPEKVCKKPPEPFTTSRIQQTASNELHFSPKETMTLCQNLYEAGYITYMRTDSKTYSREFIESAKEHIVRTYAEGEKYIHENIEALISGSTIKPHENETPAKKKTKTKTKNQTNVRVEEAHEAIRTTNISLFELPENANAKEKRLYKLIWTNTLESCMASAFFYAIVASLTGLDNTRFSYRSEQIYFPGWMIVAKKYKEESKEYNYLRMARENELVPYKKMCSKVILKGLKQHFTEARLIQCLEERGIGRPSTYSSLVEKIQERGYVKKRDIAGRKIVCQEYELQEGTIVENKLEREFGNEKNKLVIQPLGTIVIEFLDKHFLSLFNYDYTREMEEALDQISKGETNWQSVCAKCNEQLDLLIDGLKGEKKLEIQVDDSHSYIVGKYGPVLKCVEEVHGKKEITFKPVKKDIALDQIERGEFTVDQLVDAEEKKKQCVLGEYEGHPVTVKKGKFGLYITWGENSKPLKSLGNRPLENITMNDVKPYLEEGSNIIREISSTISVRRGKTDYLFYKTSKMKKPQFFDISKFYKETKEDYKTCSITVLKEWIKNTYQVF